MVWAIRAALKKYRQQREGAEAAGEDVERLLIVEPPLSREAWRRIRGWYIAAVYHLPPSTQVTHAGG